MRQLTGSWRAIAVVALLVSAGACRYNDPLRVSTIQVGRSLNSDNSVGGHTTRFKPDDTMYVSVLTGAAGSGRITVRWKYGSRLVSEETKSVRYLGSAATEFHIQSSAGFPPGMYQIEVLLDDQPVGTRDFRVER